MAIVNETVLAVHAGQAAISDRQAYVKGASLADATGDALLQIYRGSDTTNLIAEIRVSDEQQFAEWYLHGDGIGCPDGVYYALVGASSVALLYYE